MDKFPLTRKYSSPYRFVSGAEVVRNALSKLKQTKPTHWIEVVIEVAPNKVTIIDQKVGTVAGEVVEPATASDSHSEHCVFFCYTLTQSVPHILTER